MRRDRTPVVVLVAHALRRGPQTTQEMARCLGRAPETINTSLRTLEKIGIAVRTGEYGDARGVVWRLDATGLHEDHRT